MSPPLSVLSPADFERLVLRSQQLVLVDVWAEWCPPCQWLMPAVERIADEFEGRVKVFKLNLDQAGEVAERYQVRSIPNLLFFRDGELVDRVVGSFDKELLRSRLELLLRS